MKKLALILLFACSSVFAQSKTDGNVFLGFMSGNASYNDGFAMGVISGIADMMPCVPGGVTNGQMYDIVKKHLQQNPENRHASYPILIFWALDNAFPCKQETKSKKPV